MARSGVRAQTACIRKGDAMNTAIKSIVTAAALAAATIGTVGTASAREYVPVQSWQQQRYAYGEDYGHAYGYGRYDRDGRGDACRVPRWDPQTRYMPGDIVRRHGEVFQATRGSARVWN